MMRVSLSDDIVPPDRDPVLRVAAGLDEDPQPWKVVEVNPTLTVRVRTRPALEEDRYDDDGDAVFTWAVLVEDIAIEWEQRQEIDEISGASYITATATILYVGATEDATEKVTETSVVDVSTGGTFRVTQVVQVNGRLELEMVRMDGDGDADD